MGDISSLHSAAAPSGRVIPSEQNLESVLFELEERYGKLCAELAGVEARLRQLRTAADVCPLCGGTGQRWVRGGLYGEMQQRPCTCEG